MIREALWNAKKTFLILLKLFSRRMKILRVGKKSIGKNQRALININKE